MLNNSPYTGTQQPAAPVDLPTERLYLFVCYRCAHRFSVLHQQLRNLNLPDDTPCPKCGSSYCHREAGPILAQPTAG